MKNMVTKSASLRFLEGKGQSQRQRHNIYMATATSSILQLQRRCASQTADVQLRPQPKPTLKDFGLQPHSHTYSPSLPLNGLHPRNPCTWITTHLLAQEGWMAELA